jgi:hypothetical protein
LNLLLYRKPWRSPQRWRNPQVDFRVLVGELFYGLKELQVIVDQWAGTTTPSERMAAWTTDRQRRRLGFNAKPA